MISQANDLVCFDVSVTPLAGDNNTANNNYSQCFTVTNSFDPNEKEVSPSGSIDTSQHELTYTIYFQNTGYDTAQFIYIKDTLDNAIDESSIQLLAYSHEPMVQVMGKLIRFNFPNINLPDSTTDVFIKTAVTRFPEVNSNVVCRSLTVQPGAAVKVKTGFNIDIKGKDQ